MGATALSPRSLRLPSRLLRAAPDERLVAALRRGDEKAFEEIYDRHHRALLGFCRHMLGSHEEAEDALQHVFVSAHRHLCEASANVNLKPWLYTIARNRCVSMLRARRETLALDGMQEPSSEGLAVADEVELGEDVKEMLGDIARLPVDQRAALVLAELGDLSQQEIAAILDVRTDKVKALIFQAREALAGWRQARVVSCPEICEQLATLNGSALRRAPIRRHLALCPTCAAFEGEVKRQRAALALLLPVIPRRASSPACSPPRSRPATAPRRRARAARWRRGGRVWRWRRRFGSHRQGARGGRARGWRRRRRGRRSRARSAPTCPAPNDDDGGDARGRAVAAPAGTVGERRLGIPPASIGAPQRSTPRAARPGTHGDEVPRDVPRRVKRRVAARGGRPRAAPRVGGGRRRAATPAGSGRRRAVRGRRTRNSSRPPSPARRPRRLAARSLRSSRPPHAQRRRRLPRAAGSHRPFRRAASRPTKQTPEAE